MGAIATTKNPFERLDITILHAISRLHPVPLAVDLNHL